jgi:hypothetical protein
METSKFKKISDNLHKTEEVLFTIITSVVVTESYNYQYTIKISMKPHFIFQSLLEE